MIDYGTILGSCVYCDAYDSGIFFTCLYFIVIPGHVRVNSLAKEHTKADAKLQSFHVPSPASKQTLCR